MTIYKRVRKTARRTVYVRLVMINKILCQFNS